MPDDDWGRPYFEPGGGDAFVFFAVFGPSPDALEISTERHRVEELPESIDIDHQPADVAASLLDPPLGDTLLAGWSGVPFDALVGDGCTILRGVVPDPPDLLYLRNTIGIITALLEAGGRGVLSLQSLGLHTEETWIKTIFLPDQPRPTRHVTTLHSDDETGRGLEWVHTRGMRLFGRPDVSVRDVPSDQLGLAAELCTRFIEAQARGLIIAEGQPVQVEGVPDGMICHHAGHLDDPDFNNVHVELVWPRA